MRAIEKIAEYEVERLAVYASSGTGKGTEKTLSVWIVEFGMRAEKAFAVQIGSGKMHFCRNAERHAELVEFHFGDTKPQRWAKI